MAGESVSTGFPGVVKEIHLESMTYIAQEGVMKNLVTRISGTGYQVWKPYFDPTASATVTQGTEGTAFTTNTAITTTRRLYTCAEWLERSVITDRSRAMASEDVKSFHAQHHGFSHAQKLETALLACLASGTSSITATSSTGLTWAKTAAARVTLERVPKAAPKPYSFVLSPDQLYHFNNAMTGNANYGPVGTLADTIQQKYAVATLVGGVNVFQSSYFTASSGYQKAGMFSKSAINLFVPNDLDYKLESMRDIDMRGDTLMSCFYHGSRIAVPPYCVTVNAKSTQPS